MALYIQTNTQLYSTVTPVGYLLLTGGNSTVAPSCVLAALVSSNSRSNSNHHFFCKLWFKEMRREQYLRYLLCLMSEQPKSEAHDDSCVSSCFKLSTHSSVSPAIHFIPPECAIKHNGPCLKGFACATDTMSKALRLPLSPACL